MRMERLGFGVCLLLVGSASALFSQPSFEGKLISRVTFDPVAQPLAADELDRWQALRPGTVFRAENATATIQGLFDTGRYEDIQVEGETESGGGVAVRIVTRVAWFVGHVSVSGKVHSPPSRTQLVEATRLALGTPFREQDLTRAQRSLSRLLERNGLHEATIRVETTDRADIQQRDIQFIVESGHRAKYEAPVITGEPILSEDTIVKATGWRWRFIGLWKHVTQEKTRKGTLGILKRYQKDDRLTASVRTEKSEYDPATRRLKTTLAINAGPQIDVTAVEAKVSKRKLKRYVPVFEELAVNRDLLVEGSRNLRDYFQSQGYYEVDVEFRERDVDADHRTIEYVIATGNRYKLVHVGITGNKYFGQEDLLERMFLLPATFRVRRGRFSEVFLRRDEESIVNLYRSNGFRDVKVTSTVEKDYRGKANDVAVTIHVDEGSQWLVGKIAFDGLGASDAESLLARLTSAEEQPYSDVNVAGDRNIVITALNNAGYPDATFQWRETLVPETHRVNLVYTVKEGRHQLVRDVIITGVTTTRMSMVQKNLDIHAGDPLSQIQLSEMQKRLYKLGVFGQVDVAIQNAEGSSESKYVLYDIHEASRYSVAFGAGAEFARIGGTTSDLSTPAGKTGFSPRVSMDVSRLNFLGLGHTISLRGRVSNLEQLSSVNYLAPRFRNKEGRNITFTALYNVSRDVRTFSSRRQEASVQLSQQLSRASTIMGRFAYRRVSTSSVVIPSLLIPALLQPVRIGVLSTNFVNDRRDNPAESHRGVYTTVDLAVASKIFGSQRSFVRGIVRNATYYRVRRNTVLARETTFGAILPFGVPAGLTAIESIPLPERFYGGGSNTHRGFPENQAGPRDIGTGAPGTELQATGFPLGGNALLFNQTELRFPLLGDNIGGVLFHDFGNIFQSISKISFRVKQPSMTDFNYMVHAVGAGIRYRTPLGPIRVDLAYSINPPRFIGFKGTIQELLNCGPSNASTCQGTPDRISHFQFFFSIGQTF